MAQQVRAAADATWRLAIARGLVAAKLANYGTLANSCLGRNQDYVTGRALDKFAAEARQAATVDERGTRTTIAWQEPLPQREPVLLIG